MPKPIYLFRLRKDAGTYYQVSAGAVTTSPSAVNLLRSVLDWEKLQMQWKRHTKYLGVFRYYSPDTVRFVNDAAKILRYLFNTQGATEAVCYLEVQKLKSTDQLYYPRGLFAIDFSKYVNTVDYVDVHLMEGGLSALLNANDTTEQAVELGNPATDPDTEYLWMDGLILKGQVNYQTQVSGNTLVSISTLGAIFNTSILGMAHIGNEGEYGAVIGQSVICDGSGTITALAGVFSEKWIFSSVKAGTYTLTIDPLPITMALSSSNPDFLNIQIWASAYSSASFGSLIPFSELMLWSNTGGFLAPGTALSETTPLLFYTRTLPAGAYIILYYRVEASGAHSGTPPANNVNIYLPANAVRARVQYDYIHPASPCRAMKHATLFKNLFHKLTGSTAVDPISNLLVIPTDMTVEALQIIPKNTFFTCGDGLRRLYSDANGNAANPKIKITIADFVNDAFVSLGGALGIELDGAGNEVLRLERIAHFFKNEVAVDLGSNISDWKMYPYTEYLANNYTTGSRDYNYSDVNGRYECNATVKVKSNITRVQNDIDLTTPIRDDCYGAEYTRINFDNKETTDSENDNEVFKVQSDGVVLTGIDSVGITPDPYRLDRTHTITAGLPADVAARVYNVAHTPRRKLGHLLTYLKSCFYGIVAPVLKFQTGTKNTKLVSRMGLNPYITEEADQDLSSTGGDIIFKPWVFELKAKIPIDLPETMAIGANKKFLHTVHKKGRRHVLGGYVLDIGITDATNDTYAVKLLCSSDTEIDELL